jgi:Cu-Zn family superoxide dismutase
MRSSRAVSTTLNLWVRSEGSELRGALCLSAEAIVVHVVSDDNITDPSGNSGDRIACGVILLSVINGVIHGS